MSFSEWSSDQNAIASGFPITFPNSERLDETIRFYQGGKISVFFSNEISFSLHTSFPLSSSLAYMG